MKQTKFTTSICHGALSLVLALSLALSLGSCTKEPLWRSLRGCDGIEVGVTFDRSVSSKAANDPIDGSESENRLDRVTILIFNQAGTKLETELSVDLTADNGTLSKTQPKWASDRVLVVSPVVDPTNPKQIYAIANWDENSFDKSNFTVEMLKEKLKTITAVAEINGTYAYPMLMSGSETVESLTKVNYAVTVNIARQVAKVNAVMTLNQAVQNKLDYIEWQTDQMTITMSKVPDKSYVISRGASPEETKWINSEAITVVDLNVPPTTPATADLKWSASTYINENPIMDKEQKNVTFILVKLPYKDLFTGVVVSDNYYKLLVNDPLDLTSPHKVLRNTIYNFKINIIGLGLKLDNLLTDVNIEDELTVNRWDEGGNIEVDNTLKYFNIDRTSLSIQMDGKSASSTIATDVADWKLVDADGATLLSFEQNKMSVTVKGITYTLGGTASASTILVSNDAIPAPAHTQSMFVIAQNLKVPFKVTLDNGFIPNKLLLAKGWPEDILPTEGGLQLAKSGSKVLPSGVAGVDPTIYLKSNKIATICVESVATLDNARFGMGKGSTDAMTKRNTDVSMHPAAKYCREMGSEWYVPSMAELTLIDDYREILGESYKFSANTSYWSATQSGEITVANDASDKSSWTMLIGQQGAAGTPTISSKNASDVRLRCVKGDIPPPAGSFIPTAHLNGWPQSRLPKTGLQLATRGVQRLPGAAAVAYIENNYVGAKSLDGSAQCKLEASETVGVGYLPLLEIEHIVYPGSGKNDTDIMTKTTGDANLHPAANYCRQMGPEWYLASFAGLKYLMAYQISGQNGSSTLVQAYKFDDAVVYLGSTQYIDKKYQEYGGKACGTSRQKNSMSLQYINKTTTTHLRCVREI